MLSLFALASLVFAPAAFATTLTAEAQCVEGTENQAEVSVTPSLTLGGEGFDTGEVTVTSGDETRTPEGATDNQTSTVIIPVQESGEITVNAPERFDQPTQTLTVDLPCTPEQTMPGTTMMEETTMPGGTTMMEETMPEETTMPEQYENEAPAPTEEETPETPAATPSVTPEAPADEESMVVVEEKVVEAGGTPEQAEAVADTVAEGGDTEAAADAAAEAGAGEAVTEAAVEAAEAESDAITVLPDTGGASVFALGAGALLVAGGLLARRIVRG